MMMGRLSERDSFMEMTPSRLLSTSESMSDVLSDGAIGLKGLKV